MTGPGADERRIRHLLTTRGVGYAPQKPPPPTGWWDALYDDAHTDHHPSPDTPHAPAPRLPDWRKGETSDLRGDDPDRPDEPAPAAKTTPAAVEPDEDDQQWTDIDEPAPTPRPGAARRAHAAYLDLPGRLQTAIYTGTAAAGGYTLGLVPLFESWITNCGTDTSTTAALILGSALVIATGTLIDRRTRHWWGPLPWLCRIPLASALLALALYAPGATP